MQPGIGMFATGVGLMAAGGAAGHLGGSRTSDDTGAGGTARRLAVPMSHLLGVGAIGGGALYALARPSSSHANTAGMIALFGTTLIGATVLGQFIAGEVKD